MSSLVKAENIIKSYGFGDEKRRILDRISVEINEGEFISIMGPSGSGKSTLLYALSGMERVDEGSVEFNGRILSDMNDDEHAKILRNEMGFIFQQPTLIKNLNILDNIILPSAGNIKKRSRKAERARSLMKSVGIPELENRKITQASGGQLQRAGICRAIMNDPKIIFGDEPTGALNSKSAEEIMDILSGINADGRTILIVTHDARVAARTERILFLLDGKIESEINYSKYSINAREERISCLANEMNRMGI